jgi:TolB-like protein/class 3 adenylate cyclase/Flp pilus assembly protein TadD
MTVTNERSDESVRRLSAIMFTDMVGYTALVQDDEANARTLRRRWRAALDQHISAHSGSLLQTYGDGSLSVFDSAVSAVECAVALQRDLRSPPAVPIRIGVHTGDVVYDRDGVFGDGVNVASRIQSLAEPGSVLVSAKVFDEIKNQRGLDAVSLGEFDLKNVRRPMEVFALVADGLVLPRADALADRAASGRNSVAVLPFTSMSTDPENEIFSDGVTEELINALTRVNGLQVTARTSSFAFKGRQHDVREIASQLGVATVLEGSVRKVGERVRITAQLVDAKNGYHLFSQTWDRDLADIFATQDEIARAIVRSVHDRLLGEAAAEKLVTAKTDSAAHAVYLKGLREYNRWAPESLRAAIAYHRKAIQLDPSYAPAYYGLGIAYLVVASYGQMPPAEAYAEAEQASRRAVELDPGDGRPHATLGLVRLFADWDFEGAWSECQKAIGMSPGSALVRHAWATWLLTADQAARAVEEMEIAVQLDPLSPLMLNTLATALYQAGRYDDAIRACDRALEIDPAFRAALNVKASVLIMQRRYEDALRIFDRIIEITGDPYKGLFIRGFVYTRLGRIDEARQAREMLIERQRRNPGLALELDFMLLHYALGEFDAAFAMFNRLVARRAIELLVVVRVNPIWAELRERPEYWTVLERHGLARFMRGEESAPPRAPGGAPHADTRAAATQPAATALVDPHATRAAPSSSHTVSSGGQHDSALGAYGTGAGRSPTAAPPAQTLLAVLSGIDRKGAWVPARMNRVVAVLGGGTLDLREVPLAPGSTTTFEIYAVLGGIQVIVGPGTAVDTSTGMAILGAFAQGPRPPEPLPPDAPLVRITGLAVLGGVQVHFRYPGETEMQAYRRLGWLSDSGAGGHS